ncbi:hypothetical protein ACFL3V_00520 [Nanoarchaeota archaeon]
MTRFHNNRKAQITVFMIIGVILLFSSALLFYIRGQITTGLSGELIPSIEEVSLEAQPVKIFVEDCVKKIGREAIEKIGLHGGYVDPDNMSISGTIFLTGMEPTESDGIMLFDKSGFIPYWWYLKSHNKCSGTCEFDSFMPPLRKTESLYSIEGQLDAYINRELVKCVDGFKAFQEQGFDITELGRITTDAKVAEREIAILVDYPLQISREGKKTEISAFFTKLDVRFKDIYDVASKLAMKEAEMQFLETHTMNLISMYSQPVSMNKLPPIAAFSLDPTEFLFWTRTRTKEKMEQNMLTSGIASLQLNGSRDFKRVVMFKDNRAGELIYDGTGTGVMDNTVISVGKSYPNIRARFTYLDWWPIYLNINDREVLMPTTISIPIISWLGFKQYVFLYSVAYPVMVDLNDNTAFAGEGFDFRFALEQNLRYNQPINMSNGTVFREEQGTLICSQNQKQSAPVTIEVKDRITGRGITDAIVSLEFGVEGCHVGLTEIDSENRSVIETSLPIGLGDIRVTHINYIEHVDRFYASPTREKNLTVELMPFKMINVSVFARPLAYQDYNYILPPAAPVSSLSRKEMYLFLFERVDEDPLKGYRAYTFGYGQGKMSTMKMMPGTYEVKGYLIYNDTVRIPKETKVYDGGIFGDDVPIELNETLMDRWQEGGVSLDNESGYFHVPEDELFSSKKLNLFVLRFPLPATHTTQLRNMPGLEQVGEVRKYSSIYRTELEPEWIK